jgi:FkbM family methyltransferase
MVKKWYTDNKDRDLRYDYNLKESSIVLDLGGYEGQWASDIFSRYACQIIVFEPIDSYAVKIQKRFSSNNKIEVCKYGLGASSRSETINIAADGSSVFSKVQNISGVEKIQILDVKEWIEERGFGHIDLVKINIEGGEYELLERLIELNLVGIIDNIQVQFHAVADDSELRMDTIQRKLSETHQLSYQYKFVWENWSIK